MKKGTNGKNLDIIMITKARVVRKSLFYDCTSKQMEGMSISQPHVGQVVHYR